MPLTLVMAALIGQDILALFGISIGSFATVILHAEHADGLDGALAIGVVILLMCGALLVAPCAAGRLSSLLEATGINVLTRLMGMILAASAVKMMAGGLVDMFPPAAPRRRLSGIEIVDEDHRGRDYPGRRVQQSGLGQAAHQGLTGLNETFRNPEAASARRHAPGRRAICRRLAKIEGLPATARPGMMRTGGVVIAKVDNKENQMNVLITGAAGYIGAMLVDQFAYSNTIERLICIDIKERPARFGDHAKVRWIRADVAGDRWAPELQNEPIDVVIHCAYQIRELYGHGRAQQRRWNIEGACKVFEFALGQASVRRLVQLSTITAYGALPRNSLNRPFTEEMPLSEDAYLYGVQKKQVEDLLWQSYRQWRPSTHVVVLRLASVSGPRGRFGLNRYGLLSTIAGNFPALICGRSDWGRQYLHEDDLIAVLSMLVHLPPANGYQVYNVSPADFLDAAALGRLFDKRVVVLPPALLRTLFSLSWHGTRGMLATPRGAWRMLTYPIRVDSARFTQAYGYEYRYSSLQALVAQEGRYAHSSPTLQRSRSGIEAF